MQNNFSTPVQQVSKLDLFFERLAMCGKVLTCNSFLLVVKDRETKKNELQSINLTPKEIHNLSQDIYVKTFDVVIDKEDFETKVLSQ